MAVHNFFGHLGHYISINNSLLAFKCSSLYYTGTPLHADTGFTDAFNTIFTGHKWWIFLPKDIYELEKEMICDVKCSNIPKLVGDNPNGELDKDIMNINWFKHILPQIRYLKSLLEKCFYKL